MPVYEYRCEKGHTFEVTQRMTDPPVTKCDVCGATVQRVFHPVAVHFKGKGFYNTDYGTRKRARETAAAADEGVKKTDAKAKEKAKAKAEKTATSSSSSSSSTSKPSS